MIIINESYFQGELYLPGLEHVKKTGVALALQVVGDSDLSWFVNKYESEYLIKLLGENFACKFLEGIQEEYPIQKWIDLKNRLSFAIGDNNYSPIANYIYYWVMRSGKTQTSIIGEKKGKATYSSNAYIDYKVVKAWNDGVDMSVKFLDWLKENNSQYEEYQIDSPDWNILSKINTII